MSNVWDPHAAVLANVQRMNRYTRCRCGARDWTPTNPRGVWLYLLTFVGITHLAFRCRLCGAITHIGRKKFRTLHNRG